MKFLNIKNVLLLSLVLSVSGIFVDRQLCAMDATVEVDVANATQDFRGLFDSLIAKDAEDSHVAKSKKKPAKIKSKVAFEELFKIDGEDCDQHLIALYKKYYEAIDVGDTSAYWSDDSLAKKLYRNFVTQFWAFCDWASFSLRSPEFYGSEFTIGIDGSDVISSFFNALAVIDARIAMENPKAVGKSVYVSHIETANTNYFSKTKQFRMPNRSGEATATEEEKDAYESSTHGFGDYPAFDGDAFLPLGPNARLVVLAKKGSQVHGYFENESHVSYTSAGGTEADRSTPTQDQAWSLWAISLLSGLSVPALDIFSRLSLEGFQDPRMYALAAIVAVVGPSVVAAKRNILG
ncbi:hypothetical protein FJ364_03800 [Candidatus Dependentiae bacterium]|nr:hypothetical protein [Candidatus Dependentiae bacterium]